MKTENDVQKSFSVFRFAFSVYKVRLDLFLKTSRLIPRRSLAQEFCDAGLIKVNGAPAKSSKEVKANDEIEIKRRNRLTRLKILEIPAQKQVSKQAAPNLFEILGEEILAEDLF
ncbi:MAG TPA: RNA-binding S4 domain-containing protein [Pyrinomonadaceae bacterium]